jgi:dihydroneopterin aldolase
MIDDEDYLRIRLHNVVTECRCGLHPWEQHPERPTRLIVSIDLYVALGPGAVPENEIVDYDQVREFIRTFPSRPHTRLLETIANELTAVCFRAPAVQACRIALTKPDIFNEVEGAGIEVFRTRGSWQAKA